MFPNFSENETCLAKSLDDQRWYRASCQQKIDDNTYSMMYLDYGNMELVPVERIREMINEEFAFPCITSLCFIDGMYMHCNTIMFSSQVLTNLFEFQI